MNTLPIELQTNSFHDQGISKIEFNFDENVIRIDLEVYNDEDLSGEIISYQFLEVANLQIKNISIGKLHELEINALEILVLDSDFFNLSLKLLQGHGQPLGEMKFIFRSCVKK